MSLATPLIMGVVNVTPDSFSDGGRFLNKEAAIRHALELIEQGADMLDVGGESTRPGATPVSADEEMARILPLIEGVRRQSAVTLSVDTMKPEVMRAAHAAGADIWNDVTALRDSPDSLATAAELSCDVVLMHMQGEPGTMQRSPHYDDVTGEVKAQLLARAEAAMAAGVRREAIWLDPGIGFGKSLEHNLALLRDLQPLGALGFRTLLGVSRKSFIRAIDPAAKEAADRLGGSIACAIIGAHAGVTAVRVHDVRETAQALKVWAAVRTR